MKLNKIAVVAAMVLGASMALAQQKNEWANSAAQTISAMPANSATMQEAINGAAGEVMTAFSAYAQDTKNGKPLRALTAKSNLAGWMILEDEVFKPSGRFMDEKALQSAREALTKPRSVKPWFTPLDDKLKAFVAGNNPAGEDALLRLFAVANLEEFSQDELTNGMSGTNSPVEMAAHYFMFSRKAQFASAFSAQVAKGLKPKYKTADEFKADFVRVVMAMPPEQIKDLFLTARANAEIKASYQATFSLFEQSERWTTKGQGYEYAYTLTPFSAPSQANKGLTIEKSGQPVYGMGYIGGKFQTVQVDELESKPAISVSSK